MRIRRILYVLILGVITVPAAGQVIEQDRSRLNQAAYFVYTEPGDIAIRVHVWGMIKYPGLYEVPRGTNLNELISLAGGPQLGERLRRSRKTLEVTLFKDSRQGMEPHTSIVLSNKLADIPQSVILEEGDMLTFDLEVRQRLRWRDMFPVVSMVGTLILIIDRLSN